MDIENGDVLALVSTPDSIERLQHRRYAGAMERSDHRRPQALINKTLPGPIRRDRRSRPFTALAALDAGAITPETVFHCSGVVRLGSHDFIAGKRAATAR